MRPRTLFLVAALIVIGAVVWFEVTPTSDCVSGSLCMDSRSTFRGVILLGGFVLAAPFVLVASVIASIDRRERHH
jgi:hypothetical protein